MMSGRTTRVQVEETEAEVEQQLRRQARRRMRAECTEELELQEGRQARRRRYEDRVAEELRRGGRGWVTEEGAQRLGWRRTDGWLGPRSPEIERRLEEGTLGQVSRESWARRRGREGRGTEESVGAVARLDR